MKELAQYLKTSEQEATGAHNELFPVKETYLEKLRDVIGSIPRGLEEFWAENGYGYLQQASTGGRPSNFANMLLSPSTIASYLGKSRYRKHFDNDGEISIPFFQADDDILLGYVANGPRVGAIVTYGTDRAIVTNSIQEFVQGLLVDPEFYLKENVVPSQTRWLV